MNKLTPDIFKQLIKVFGEEDDDYYLTVYHFVGFIQIITEATFNELESNDIQKE